MKEELLKGLRKLDKQLSGEEPTTLTREDLEDDRSNLLNQLEELEDSQNDYVAIYSEIFGDEV